MATTATAHERANPFLPVDDEIRDLRAHVVARGKCTTGPDDTVFFSDELPVGRASRRTQAQQAAAACSGCLVRTACLELALRTETRTGASWGVQGGMSALDRHDLIAERAADAARADTLTATLRSAGLEIPAGSAMPTEHTGALALIALAVLHAAQARPHIATALLHALTTPATTGPRALAS